MSEEAEIKIDDRLLELSETELEKRNMIKIDNYIFEICCYNILQSDRIIIFVSTNNYNERKIYYSIYYRSLSELGFWRLLVLDESTGAFLKGEDYVMSTFVDMRLQIFFSRYYRRSKKEINLAVVHDFIFNKENKDEYQARKKIQIGEEMKLTYEERRKSRSITKNYISSDRIRVIQELNNIKTNASCHNSIGRLTSEQINKFLEPFSNKYIAKIETNKYLSEYIHDILICEDIFARISGNIYSIELVNNTDETDVLILYYLHYNFRLGISINGITYTDIEITERTSIDRNVFEVGKYSFFTKLNKYVSIGLFEKKSEITEFGLCSRIVPAGVFVCKILNYDLYINEYEADNYRLYIHPDSNYHYIGTRYDEMYPYNIIKSDATINTELNERLQKISIGGENTKASEARYKMLLISYFRSSFAIIWTMQIMTYYLKLIRKFDERKVLSGITSGQILVSKFKPIFSDRFTNSEFINKYYKLFDLLHTFYIIDKISKNPLIYSNPLGFFSDTDRNRFNDMLSKINIIMKRNIKEIISRLYPNITDLVNQINNSIDTDICNPSFFDDTPDYLKNNIVNTNLIDIYKIIKHIFNQNYNPDYLYKIKYLKYKNKYLELKRQF